MKKLILLLFLLPFFAGAQTYQSMPQAGYGPVKRMLFDSVLTLPLGITKLQNISGGRDVGQLRYNISDSSLYTYSGSRWIKSGIDTSTIYYNLGLKLNISDTAAMMAAAPRVQRFLDSVANLKSSIDLKLNKTDTASLSNRINLKVNIADTASMLAPYTRATQTALKLNISDTASMLSAYTRLTANALKLNISDTAAMMAAAPRVQRFLDSVANLKTSIETKQNTLTLTTTGTSGAATLTGATLNIPQYLSANIYNSDGSLTGARTLTLNSQPLTFAGTTSTRFFANGRVTIGGIVDAGFKLDVVGGDARINQMTIGLGGGSIATNTAIGYQSLTANTIGLYNTALGYNALKTGNNHQTTVAIGYAALGNSASNNANVAIGSNSMGVTTAAGQANTCVGFETGKNLTGGYNAFYGWGSGIICANTSENAAFGAYSFYSNTTGTRNAAFGHQSLYRSTGNDNMAAGYLSLNSMTSGSKNTALGGYAGDKIGTGTSTNTNSNNSIFIGYDTRPLGLTQTNQVVIGYGTTGLGNNTTVLGNSSTSTTGLYGNIRLVSGMATAPASATAAGTVGDVRITATYIYVCTATNTWVRSALTTW